MCLCVLLKLGLTLRAAHLLAAEKEQRVDKEQQKPGTIAACGAFPPAARNESIRIMWGSGRPHTETSQCALHLHTTLRRPGPTGGLTGRDAAQHRLYT